MTDTTEFLPLHPLEYEILLLLLEEPSHAYAIVQRLEAEGAPGRRVLPANLYRRIRDLLDHGLIEEYASRGAAPARGRRDFRISALGRRVVKAEARRLETAVAAARRHGLLKGT